MNKPSHRSAVEHRQFAAKPCEDVGGDGRVVMTLDAGGTNFVFAAVDAVGDVVPSVRLSAETHDINRALEVIASGFSRIRRDCEQVGRPPVAISFAFPGPADHTAGVVFDTQNLPAFSGGVPLGPYLEHRFNLPTS